MIPLTPDSIAKVAMMLSGYDERTWNRLRPDRKRTYARAASTLILSWQQFKSVIEKGEKT